MLYSDLTEIAAERGLKLNRSTIYRWVQEYGVLGILPSKRTKIAVALDTAAPGGTYFIGIAFFFHIDAANLQWVMKHLSFLDGKSLVPH